MASKRYTFAQEYDGALVVNNVIACSPSSDGLTKDAIAQIVADQSSADRELVLAKRLLETVHGHAAIKNIVTGRKNSVSLNDLILLVGQVPGGKEMISEKKNAAADYIRTKTNPRRIAQGLEPVKLVNVEGL